jgi:hypothetical protein
MEETITCSYTAQYNERSFTSNGSLPAWSTFAVINKQDCVDEINTLSVYSLSLDVIDQSVDWLYSRRVNRCKY